MNTKPAIPIWYWIVSVIAVIWNLMGVIAYLTTAYMTDDVLKTLPADEQAYYENMPAWVMGAFALSVFSGFFGSILLLLRKGLAQVLLIVSFASVLLQTVHNLFLSESMMETEGSQIILAITIPVFALALVVLARGARQRGWMK